MNLCDKMSDLADEGRAVDIACLDFSKASETASHKILIGEVFTNGLVKQTLRGTENCLKTTQRTVMSSTRSSWRPGAAVYTRSPCWIQSLLAPSLMIWVMPQTLLQGCWWQKPRGVAIQRGHKRLEEWADRSLMKSSKKWNALHVGRNNPITNGKQLVLVATKSNMSQQWVLATKKVNRILVYFRWSIASWWKEVILPLYSALLRPLWCFAVKKETRTY